jgi:hypothetical protein
MTLQPECLPRTIGYLIGETSSVRQESQEHHVSWKESFRVLLSGWKER